MSIGPRRKQRIADILRINHVEGEGARPITRTHDTVPGRTAREWFDFLRPLVLGSRPLIEPARKVTYKHQIAGSKGTWTQTRVIPEVLGKPTFQNVTDRETGALV